MLTHTPPAVGGTRGQQKCSNDHLHITTFYLLLSPEKPQTLLRLVQGKAAVTALWQGTGARGVFPAGTETPPC